ncbi:hypothetical protein GCK72_024900 [Caenorhabditis remanei]|uniref:Cytochrome b5 heme-binding domain-containing protein n=1 Tax=Caenorhabditis remanei TaxID=31234 RepID=A0A6A5G0V6_CAERE|nr:hypothetical protein GCK72_024900 [Caenorhabditis remanei]KAF1748433.1 hypothetical protein GCK72_024900 [Caenorhabditis remanei]
MDLSSWFEFTVYDAVFLVVVLGFFFYWLTRSEQPLPSPPKELAPLTMTDMTVEELRKYDGVKNEHILFGLNGTIYDVTRGKGFYGPGKAYGTLAGHDATRALGTMDQNAVSAEWDDHAGLTADEQETANEWETQFKFKYLTVGRLVKNSSEKADYGNRKAFVRGAESLDSIINDGGEEGSKKDN